MQRETKRAAVLSCAAKLFDTKGARFTTLADVAGRLGLTKMATNSSGTKTDIARRRQHR